MVLKLTILGSRPMFSDNPEIHPCVQSMKWQLYMCALTWMAHATRVAQVLFIYLGRGVL